ncbi:type IV pilus modification PilV family protein [Halobacteroides halobius]|uniref:type IV pilus modification PilV family protein n=1 Tax=Halobacteroides halobius TaxID=42422 RepID=UPI002480C804|nr:type II secretion system protein [Halobacteroides halobius]
MVKERGFTLLEVVFAIAMLGCILIPLVTTFINSGKEIVAARFKTEAINLARWKLATQRVKEYSNLIDQSRTSFFSPEFSNYDYQIDIIKLSPNLKEVITKVYYQQRLKAKLVTIIAK